MSSCSWCYPYQSQKSPGVIDLVGLGFLRRVRAVKRCNRRAVYKPLNHRVMADIHDGLWGLYHSSLALAVAVGMRFNQKTAELGGMPRTGLGWHGFVFQGVFVPP